MTDKSSGECEKSMALVGARYGGARQWLARLMAGGMMV